MEENQTNQQLNNYEIKRQQRIEEKKLRQRKRMVKTAVKTAIFIAAILGPIAGLTWYGLTRPPTPETDIISKKGVHWHPQLSITIKGQKQEIPANIGMGGGAMQTFHTHDKTGELHLERQGLITKNDIMLAGFFKIWGKEFNQNCIFDSCNGPNGKLTILVNGKENTEFNNYQISDKDKIEIKFE